MIKHREMAGEGEKPGKFLKRAQRAQLKEEAVASLRQRAERERNLLRRVAEGVTWRSSEKIESYREPKEPEPEPKSQSQS